MRDNNLKRLIASLILIAFSLIALFPLSVFAVAPIEQKEVTATIRYTYDDVPVTDAYFELYYLAEVDAYAHFSLTEVFRDYPIALDDMTQSKWNALAETVKGYVKLDNISPVDSGKTDAQGSLVFPQKAEKLMPGMYLVIGARRTVNDYMYSAEPFIACLPNTTSDDNVWEYDVTFYPKAEKSYNPDDGENDKIISRRALKIWDDYGFESKRPEEITVHLLMDNEVYDTVSLNKSNNWRYSWDELDAKCEWTVVEDPVEGYTVAVEREKSTFTITNTFIQPVISDPPVSKKIVGDRPAEDSVFTFVMEAQGEDYPMPEGSDGKIKEVYITGEGSVEFGNILFEKPGLYVYTIKEKNTGVDGYTYDQAVYYVEYDVRQDDNKLTVTRTFSDSESNTVNAVVFTNQYKTPGSKLPQTGVLWWPVPVLFALGLLFITVGIIHRRGNRYEK